MNPDATQEPKFISRVVIDNISPFTERIEIDFDPRINVLIGPNSTGKTTLLRLIKSKGPGRPDAEVRPRFRYITSGQDQRGDVYVKSGQDERLYETISDFPIIWVPASRVPFLPMPYSSAGAVHNFDSYHDLDDVSDRADALFAVDVSIAINHHFRDLRDEESIRNIFAVVERAFACASDVYPEIILGTLPETYIDSDYIRSHTGKSIRVPVPRYLLGFEISDNANRITDASVMSSGIQLSYIWIIYMALRMAYFYEFRNDWFEQSAVLCVDEIENHLHPAWQRKVLRALTKHFPNLQIFATTHSPFLVAGLRAGQVHVLNRDKTNLVTARTEDVDLIAYTADEILNEMMGINYPTDIETAQAVEVLQFLRALEPIEGLAEDWRRKEIQRLTELSKGEATEAETVMLRWLSGDIQEPIALPQELDGSTEDWRRKVIAELEDEVGANILAGGAVALQRQWLLDRIGDSQVGDSEDSNA